MMQKFFSRRTAITALTMTLALSIAMPAQSFFGKKESPEKQRAEINEMREEVLGLFRQDVSNADELLADATGYAVFANTGMNLGLISSANGKGVARDNKSDDDTYMKMYSLGGGVGLGIKKFQAVFVFHSRDAFDQFVEKGWDLSGQADVAATTSSDDEEQLGAMDESVGLMKGVSVFQFTEKGLALQATLQGTKYWQDDDLN